MSGTQVETSARAVREQPSSVLPRLLYAGDVPVESSYHGSALLYRLLEDYPADKLLIVEPKYRQSLPARRLCDVEYRKFSVGESRWLNTRFSRYVGSAITFLAPAQNKRFRRCLTGFTPDAILTVAHGYSWLTAAKFAAEAKLPLHLIVHDDYLMTTAILSKLRRWQERKFARVYRQAASRLCVSPFMEEEYGQRYGIAGHVLYPSRAKQNSSYDQVPATYRKRSGPLVGAYAGNLYYREFASLIGTLAERLDNSGGKLLLFGPHSTESLSSLGLNRRNILPQGLVDSDQLIHRLREESDFVFVPMAFDSLVLQDNTRLSFPSKLTDYTATGLPILICGPEDCSAVRWARQYSPVAEIITSNSTRDFDNALGNLASPLTRESLGKAATTVGNRLFSQHAAFAVLSRALLSTK